MKKIPTVFKRNPDDMKHVLAEVNPGCEWVLAGEGIPTRKYDGTCVMHDADGWWARREVKPGKDAPPNFRPEQTDEATGKTVGWEPMEQSAFARWHAEALTNWTEQYGTGSEPFGDFGTYELVGPKINRDPEGFGRHWLVPHADAAQLTEPGSDPKALIAYCAAHGYEGIVWHHPDGRMAKLKVRDYAAS